jgi:hypothetical protein
MVDKRNCEVGTTSGTVKGHEMEYGKDTYVVCDGGSLLNIVTNIQVSHSRVTIRLYKLSLLYGVNVQFVRFQAKILTF